MGSIHSELGIGQTRWDTAMAWYALMVSSGSEEKISTKIGDQAYYPKRQTWVRKRKGNKREKAYKPLIPGYIFLDVLPGERLPYNQLEYERNIYGLVSIGGKPLTVSEREIEWLKTQERDGAYDETAKQRLSAILGREYRVASGTFSGFRAKVTGLSNETVSLDLVGFPYPVKISLAEFDKIRQESTSDGRV